MELSGLAGAWFHLGFVMDGAPARFGHDPIALIAAIARETSRIELGTAVLPIQHRHPMITAQHAATLAALSNNRFTLGLGSSHKYLIEDVLGLPFRSPVREMEEYLDAMDAALSGEVAAFSGAWHAFRGAQMADGPGAGSLPVMLGALGPRMLDLAGRRTNGTIAANVGINTLETHTIPLIRKAAAEAGRPAPRIMASLAFALTDDVAGARAIYAPYMAGYGKLPSYRAMLDREGAREPGDLLIAGDRQVLGAALRRLQDMGVDDLLVSPVQPSSARATLDFITNFYA